MSTLAEIEAAVDVLPLPEQKELLRHLESRLRPPEMKRRLPVIKATGHPITQQQIDDVLDAD